MADIKLFRTHEDGVQELPAESVAIEKDLQILLEKHLETFLGVRFLASEYKTGKRHGGRIDTLGLDDNHCPVIIEYKRSLNENVINQGLFYLDWLMDHQSNFILEVMNHLGPQFAEKIDWSGPRLLCIAADFTKYDEYAVMQIPRSVELLRYRRYGKDLLLLELVNSGGSNEGKHAKSEGKTAKEEEEKTLSLSLQNVWEALKAFLLGFGDDVSMKELAHYVAFRRIKNFACVKVQQGELVIWAKVDPTSITLEEHFTKDVTNLGHLGTGNLEIRVKSNSDLEKAKPLLTRSYQEA